MHVDASNSSLLDTFSNNESAGGASDVLEFISMSLTKSSIEKAILRHMVDSRWESSALDVVGSWYSSKMANLIYDSCFSAGGNTTEKVSTYV